MFVRAFALLPVLLVTGASFAVAQNTSTPSAAPPVAAKLVTVLDSSEMKAGKKFQAYVLQQWSDGHCTLRQGAVLQGHVTQVNRRTKANKNADFDLVIDSGECQKHHQTPLHMSLIALLGPADATPGGESGVAKGKELTEQPNPIGGLRSAESPVYNDANNPAGRSVPTQWSQGMVVDLPGTTLNVGGGAEGATVVTGTNEDARLPVNTMLILRATS